MTELLQHAGGVGIAAARMITPGSTVILDSGDTALDVVMALPPDLDATIITHSATIAVALARHPTATVRMLTGRLSKRSVTVLGTAAAEAAGSITADLALLIGVGIHPHEGLTAADPENAAIRRILASRAAATYVLASTEKLGTVCAYKIAGLSGITGIITDAPATHPVIVELRAQGVTIIPAA